MITAIQDLIECIRFTDKECYATMFNEGVFDKSLEKEKEQMYNAWKKSAIESSEYDIIDEIEYDIFEQYYNKTYNQNES
jgi:hypothetical protein